MLISESYKKRLQELSGMNPKDFSTEEYTEQLKKLGIENFEDLVGRTVYYIKPTYGEHKVLKWLPDRGEYLLFTYGQKVFANPFNIIPILEKTDRETDSELKWVIERLCVEEVAKKIDIKNMIVDENGSLIVTFDLITEDFKYMNKRIDVEVLYKDVVLSLEINKRGLSTFLEGEGSQEIIKSTDESSIGHKWDAHAPFIGTNYQTTEEDRRYMKKIVENIILEKI